MQYLDKYAELLLKAGVALQKGQNLVIQTEPIHAAFALQVEQMAYQMGARYVMIEFTSPKSRLNRANHSDEKFLEYVPSFIKEKTSDYVSEGWAMIFISGMEDMDAHRTINLQRNAIIHKTLAKLSLPLIEARMDGTCPWCICQLPTPAWARSIYPNQAQLSDEEICLKIWEEMIPILRLEKEDPIATWREHAQILKIRAGKLNEHKTDYLHFQGGGTDLKVYLTPYSEFIGGSCISRSGHEYFPNLPTEEFFTAPDCRKTTGRAVITRPVHVLGENVQGAWFEFRDGAVVDYGADTYKDRLDAYFEMDEGAMFLGEVALVDCSSPIFESGLIFNSILYDENAACHIALGRTLSDAMPSVMHLDTEELVKLGYNDSVVHTDFMIGSEALNVTAVSATGEKMEVIRNGYFTI